MGATNNPPTMFLKNNASRKNVATDFGAARESIATTLARKFETLPRPRTRGFFRKIAANPTDRPGV